MVLAQMMETQTSRHGVDDIAGHLRCPRQILFFVWVSLNERKWVILAERRGDKGNVRKHEIARSVFCRLNDAGEPALTLRREVLRRISEFEDFSSCWDDDRLKAQGLVGQIQKLVNVKDSFTRINLEREKERKQHQAAYTASLQAKQTEAAGRAALKDSLYKLFGETDPHQRGKRLEGILNSLFSIADNSCGLIVFVMWRTPVPVFLSNMTV